MADSDAPIPNATNDDLILHPEETVEDSMNTTSISLVTQYGHPHTLRPATSQTFLNILRDLDLQEATLWRTFSEMDLDYSQLMGHEFYYSHQTLTTTFQCTPPPVPATKSAFQKLAPELKNKIWDYLNPCASTCLGLTCREFYSIHGSFHRAPTDFSSVTFIPNPNPNMIPTMLQLWELIEVWMADQGFRFKILPNGSEVSYFRKGRWWSEPVERYKERGMNERWRTWCARTRKWVYDRGVMTGVGKVAYRSPLWRRVLVDVEDEIQGENLDDDSDDWRREKGEGFW